MIDISFQYNHIQDIGEGYVLWKNSHLKPAGNFRFKDVLVEFGFDPSSNNVKLRRIGYLKKDYSLKQVQELARKTKYCPFCIKGKPLNLLSLNKNEAISYINKNYTNEDDKIMVTITDWMDALTKMPQLNKLVIPQAFSRLINLVGSLVIPNEVIRRLGFNLGGGLAGLIANEYFIEEGRLKDELRVFFGNWLTNAIPNLDINKFVADAEELTRAFRFGGPLDVLKTMFQSPIERIQAGIKEVTRAIGFGGQMPIGFQPPKQLPIGFQAPGQIRGTRMPEYPIPFGQQVAATGFQLPPSTVPTTPGGIFRGSEWQSPGPRMAGFRVTESKLY